MVVEFPLFFSVYINDIPSSSLRFEFVLYADDMDTLAKSQNPKLLVSYLEA
jgi:hypothetical protein